MNIRRAIKEDYEIVCKLCKELDDHHARILPERIQEYNDIPRSLKMYESYILGDDRDLLIAFDDDIAMGFVNLRIESVEEKVMHVGRKFVLIDNVFVTEQHRSKGIGKLLMSHALSWCENKGIEKIELQVFNVNSQSIAFYQSLGFTPFLTRFESTLTNKD